MKKIFLFFVLSLISTSIFAQIKITPYFDGYWGNWNTSSFKIRGSCSGFMFYNETQGPWDCYFKFSIDNYRLPDSKQRKSDYKLGIPEKLQKSLPHQKRYIKSCNMNL